MDFTYKKYKKLIGVIKVSNYSTQTFEEFTLNPKENVIILRHDVDRLPKNAEKMAIIEEGFRIKSSYYFRIIDSVFNERIIELCANLEHEVSYHYEDLTICKGNAKYAIIHFEENLKKFRKFYPAKTICMHGSPFSKYDNRLLWDKYNYQDFGIIAEPYFDVDYNKVLYITDTGRRWNKVSISVRDRVESDLNYPIASTDDLIKKIQEGSLPSQIIINTHPHRWFDNLWGWSKEYVIQNIKNVVKYILIKFNGR